MLEYSIHSIGPPSIIYLPLLPFFLNDVHRRHTLPTGQQLSLNISIYLFPFLRQ